MKTCLKCRELKSFDAFHKNRTRGDGVQVYCKPCMCQIYRAWYASHYQSTSKKVDKPRNRGPERAKQAKQHTPRDKEKRAATKKKWNDGNREKKAAWMREWRTQNPESVSIHRRKLLLRQYNLTLEKYDALLKVQGGACANCFVVPEVRRKLVVDHDHVTGEVRGLLCNACNLGIGGLGDTVEGLERAIAYLRRAERAAV